MPKQTWSANTHQHGCSKQELVSETSKQNEEQKTQHLQSDATAAPFMQLIFNGRDCT